MVMTWPRASAVKIEAACSSMTRINGRPNYMYLDNFGDKDSLYELGVLRES